MEFFGSKTLVMMQSDRLEFDPYFFGEGCDSIADEAIHDPDVHDARPSSYPAKIIGHKAGRERALAAYRRMKR